MPSSFLTTAILALLGSSQLAAAHMDMMYPPPLKSKFNPFAKAANDIDSDMTSPLSASGANFPCKGYQTLLGTPEGASVATFAPGNKYNLTIEGGAYHDGGSCQASLSYDKGKTFTVIQSWMGQCPTATGGSFDFTIPADAPAGTDVLFAWTWFNEVGNREMYMNCASVTIGGGSSKRGQTTSKRATAFSARPALFTANIGNGCGTADNADVIFPNPGPDVVTQGSKLAKPTGTCQAAAGGSDSGSGSGSSAAATATASAGSGAASSTTAQAAGPTVSSIGAGSGSSSSGYVSPSSQPSPSPSTSSTHTPPPFLPTPKNPFTSVATFPPYPTFNTSSISTSVFVTKTFTGGGGASFTPLGPTANSSSHSYSSSSTSSSSLPGGVFVTVPTNSAAAVASASAVASTSVPTTLATSTTPAGYSNSGGGGGSATTSAASPAGTGTGTGTGTGSSGGSLLSGACTDEGAWNCIGGTSFQRCASGSWSVAMAMAAGTSCKPGVSDSLWRRGKGRVRRGVW